MMIVCSFEVGSDSNVSTPLGAHDKATFTVAQVYRTDESSTAPARFIHKPRTPTYSKLKTLYPRKFKLPKNFTIITGILLAVACGTAALIVYVTGWYIVVFILYLLRKCRRPPTLPLYSGLPVPMVVYGPHAGSQAPNLDGADPPAGLVIGDGSDTPRATTGYFQSAPLVNNLPQLVEDGAPSEVSPLLAEPEASAVNLDAFAQQNTCALEPASSIPLAAHDEGLGSNVAKEILYRDSSDGPNQAYLKELS